MSIISFIITFEPVPLAAVELLDHGLGELLQVPVLAPSHRLLDHSLLVTERNG